MIPRFIVFACLVSVSASACAGGGGTQIRSINPNPSQDDQITAQVKTTLLNDQQIGAQKIDVSTTNGVVTISGTVKTKAEEARAVELARRTPGVKDVISNLKTES